MTKEEERIVDENCSPHRLAKPGETPAGPQPEKVRGLPILRCPPQPDPLREPLARALAARFRERIAVAWEMGYGPVDIADLLADEVAGMFCGQPDAAMMCRDLPTRPPQPDPLREPLARALAARFRERIAVAWEMGVLDSYRPVDIADLLADEVAGMFCGQ